MSINLQSPQKVIQAGFSLMELLVVVAIMATIAGIGISTFGNTDDIQRTKMTQIELAELATAVIQLHTDTGFWLGAPGGMAHDDLYDWTVLTNPDLANWDPVTRRGWRGPYIQSQLAQNITITGGNSLALTGLDSGATGDYVSPPDAGVLIDPHGGPYALLFLNGRNVIVSRGSNDFFDQLGGSENEDELYAILCGGVAGDLDLIACP